ncbi:transporter, major facilitator family protein [Besnoitia besnoiti]|uniref:Transporter, major facilitator family protein n=1 Tax=Besnoitia besnoiti TaxID=94643 RepID=A0A2A9M685_BESBE|nr:transporter, major facilitator family protein [Besnoitia besnoiti]PFH33485.1 transporter, major facilitator family protein [Besnoitia besnoiti]
MDSTDVTDLCKTASSETASLNKTDTRMDALNQPTAAGASLSNFEIVSSPHGRGTTKEGGPLTSGKLESVKSSRPTVAFGLSRWVVLVAYCVYCLLAGPSFFNWTTIADTLYKSGAFEWDCKPGDLFPNALPHEPKCPDQEVAVNHLFTVASCSYFVFAMLGGIMLDFAGPKLGAFAGLACLLLGWTLFGLSCESFRAYVPAAVFMGAGIDMAFFPCLCGANLFPGYAGTIIAVYGSFRSISFVVGLALRTIYLNVEGATFRGVVLGYVGVGLGTCVLVAIFIIPRKAWTAPDAPQSAALEEDVEASGERDGQSAVQKKLSPVESMKRDFLSLSFLPLVPYFIFVLIALLFFAPSSKRLIPSAYEANQIISIFSFVPCIFLGRLTDKVGIVPVMMVCNSCGLLSWILVLIPGIPCFVASQYVISILIAIQMSFLVSQIYCYITEIFQPENLGKMVGFLCSVGGLISLVTDPMRRYSVDNSFYPMTAFCLVLAAVNEGLLLFMYCRKKKVPKVV